MTDSMNALKDFLNARKEKSGGGNTSTSKADGANYPFWNIKAGETASVRFLPDKDTDNPLFWKEKYVIKLAFSGIAGQSPSAGDRDVVVQVPTLEAFGEECPILKEVRGFFKLAENETDPALKEELGNMGRQYWKKMTCIFQGFVRVNPIKDDVLPENGNPIRRFTINKSIFKNIEHGLTNTGIKHIPIDYENGRDFNISKTQQGEFPNYATSQWSFEETPLSDVELAAIEEHGLFDLKEYIPAKPTAEQVEASYEMFQASKNGEEYDPAKWGKYFRPFGLKIADDAGSGSAGSSVAGEKAVDTNAEALAVSTKASAAKSEAVAETVAEEVADADALPEPTESATKATGGTKSKAAADIMAKIKAKPAKAKK